MMALDSAGLPELRQPRTRGVLRASTTSRSTAASSFRTKPTGRAYPRGDLRIALCDDCGFITNTAFDLLAYDLRSDATKRRRRFRRPSTAFQDAADRAAAGEVRLCWGKTVVEIGCGKGDFLARMAELGDVQGIGIDPTSVHERLTGKAAENVRFINEFYGPQHAKHRGRSRHLPAHARAHSRRRSLPANDPRGRGPRDVPVFFELPETLRVLRDAAYWDIYFEHCSYFTPGSLARAFELAGFEVNDVRLGYDNQYLMLEAQPGGTGRGYSALLDQPRDVAHEVRSFQRSVDIKRRAWKQYFEDAARSGKRIAIWGSGSKCVAFLTTLGIDAEVAFVTDINPYRFGKFIVGTGKEIVPPARLREHAPRRSRGDELDLSRRGGRDPGFDGRAGKGSRRRRAAGARGMNTIDVAPCSTWHQQHAYSTIPKRPEPLYRARTRRVIASALPVYNGAKYIEQALDSILAQTYTDFELLISITRRPTRPRKSAADTRPPTPAYATRATRGTSGLRPITTASSTSRADAISATPRMTTSSHRRTSNAASRSSTPTRRRARLSSNGDDERRRRADRYARAQPRVVDDARRVRGSPIRCLCDEGSMCDPVFGFSGPSRCAYRFARRLHRARHDPAREMALRGRIVESPEFRFFERYHAEGSVLSNPTLDDRARLVRPRQPRQAGQSSAGVPLAVGAVRRDRAR